jgi:hypothetical protein
MVRMRALGVSLLLALAGCSSSAAEDEPDWQFDQEDMEGAVLGTWTGTLTPVSGSPSALMLVVRSHDEPVRQLSCGSRTFADDWTPGLSLRCIESSALQVSATLTLGEGSDPKEFDGVFDVFGTKLDWGELRLGDANVENGHLWARWDAGAWSYCELWASDATNGPCTLDERAE